MKKIISLFVFVFGWSLLVDSQNYIINTIAGTGSNGYNGDGGAATAAKLNVPPGVAADAYGNVYIADQVNHRIRMVNSSGIISTYAGNGYSGWSGDGGPATAAEVDYPWSLTLDKYGNLYFTDTYNYAVREVSTSGIMSMVAGGGSGGDGGPASSASLQQPVGITFDKTGNLYIAEYSGGKVRIVNTNGIIETFAGGGSMGNGNPATAASLDVPTGVAVDNKGNVYISEENGNDVRVVNTSGIIMAFAGNGVNGFSGDGGPATASEMAEIEYVATDSLGNVAITDYEHNRIRIVNTSGIITTLAGGGSSLGDGGPATAAQLTGPIGINYDPYGNFYIADMYHERVRELTINTTTGFAKTNQSPESFNIYPNPNNGLFTLHSSVSAGKSSIEIYNVLGQKFFSENLSSAQDDKVINLPGKPAGMYFYRVLGENGDLVYSGKFIIQ